MTYLHAKVQGQRLVGSEDRVETNGGQRDGHDCITPHPNAIGNISRNIFVNISHITIGLNLVLLQHHQQLLSHLWQSIHAHSTLNM